MLRIDYDVKASPPVVIFCSGLKPEFCGITEGHSRLFLYDTEGLWFSKLQSHISDFLMGFPDLSGMVGVSRGGYAALKFGGILGIKTLAFSPQTSLIDERWPEIKKARSASEVHDLAHLDGDFTIYYCKDNLHDVNHAKRVKAAFIEVEGSKHNSASILKAQGKLRGIIHNFISGKP